MTLITKQNNSAASASSAQFTTLTDAQFTLGEGPEIDALKANDVVVVPSISKVAHQWPAFAAVAREQHIDSAIALPMRIGSIHIGVLTAYDHNATTFTDDTVRKALEIAKIATWQLLTQQTESELESLPLSPTETFSYRAVVHQATGMISAQLNCDIAEALVRLRAHAYAQEEPINDIAKAVVQRKYRFHD